MPARSGVDKLGIDAHLVSRTANAALLYMTHTKLCGHLSHFNRLTLVGKDRIPDNDE